MMDVLSLPQEYRIIIQKAIRFASSRAYYTAFYKEPAIEDMDTIIPEK
jgi:hypothetical protein